jgi:hypothetical protein
MARSRTVVSLNYGDGTAAVFRHPDGVMVLTRNVELGGATVLEGFRPAIVGLVDDRTIQGGLLPPGASGAEVVDDTGVRRRAEAANGAWVDVAGALLRRRRVNCEASIAGGLAPVSRQRCRRTLSRVPGLRVG